MYIMVIELRKVHVDLKLHTRFQTKIALYCLQLPLYYVHLEGARLQSRSTRTLTFQSVAKFVIHFQSGGN